MDKKKNRKKYTLPGLAGFFEAKRKFAIDFILSHDLDPDDKLLDVGCATLRAGIPLINYLNIGNYHGIDVREECIDIGRQDVLDEKLKYKSPRLYHFTEFQDLDFEKEMFDFVWGFSVLFHMTDEIANDFFKHLGLWLKSTGVFYANIRVGQYTSFNRWQGFPVMARPVSFYEDMAKKNGMVLKNIGLLKDLGPSVNQVSHNGHTMIKVTKP